MSIKMQAEINELKEGLAELRGHIEQILLAQKTDTIVPDSPIPEVEFPSCLKDDGYSPPAKE